MDNLEGRKHPKSTVLARIAGLLVVLSFLPVIFHKKMICFNRIL